MTQYHQEKFKQDGALMLAVATFQEQLDNNLKTSFESENMTVSDLAGVIRAMQRLADNLITKLASQIGPEEAFMLIHGDGSRVA